MDTMAYRKLRLGPLTFLVDGVVFRARKDDDESYFVVTGDGKKVDGYLAVVIRLADGFPVIIDIADVKNRCRIAVEEKEENRKFRKYESLADFFVPINRRKVVRKKVSLGVVRKETETDLFLRLVNRLAECGVVCPDDIFAGDSVYGGKSVRANLSSMGCLIASPVNEANATGSLKYVLRVRDAAICLLQRLDFGCDEAFSSEEFAFAHALSVMLTANLNSLSTPVGTIKMKHIESLIGVRTDLPSLIMFACVRRKRSAVSEGYNAVVKTPYVMVNRGGKLLVKGKMRVRRLLIFKVVAEQLWRLGKMLLEPINIR